MLPTKTKFVIACLLFTCISSGCATAPWTRTEKILAGVSIAASGWNIYETQAAIDRGAEEINPLIEWSPGWGMVLTEALALWFANYFPEIEVPWLGTLEIRSPLLGGKAAINTALAIHDRQVDR